VLTGGSGRAKQAKGEVRRRRGKISEIRTSGVWHGGKADDPAATDLADTRLQLVKNPRLCHSGFSQMERADFDGNVGISKKLFLRRAQ